MKEERAREREEKNEADKRCTEATVSAATCHFMNSRPRLPFENKGGFFFSTEKRDGRRAPNWTVVHRLPTCRDYPSVKGKECCPSRSRAARRAPGDCGASQGSARLSLSDSNWSLESTSIVYLRDACLYAFLIFFSQTRTKKYNIFIKIRTTQKDIEHNGTERKSSGGSDA